MNKGTSMLKYIVFMGMFLVSMSYSVAQSRVAPVKNSSDKRYISDILSGKKLLHRVVYRENNYKSKDASGGFFLLAGSYHSQEKEYTIKSVTFSWQYPDGSYVVSSVSVDKVRIKLEENIKNPYVTFEYVNTFYCKRCGTVENDFTYGDYKNYQSRHDGGYSLSSFPEIPVIMKHKVKYVIIHCKPEHWPSSISIESLGK